MQHVGQHVLTSWSILDTLCFAQILILLQKSQICLLVFDLPHWFHCIQNQYPSCFTLYYFFPRDCQVHQFHCSRVVRIFSSFLVSTPVEMLLRTSNNFDLEVSSSLVTVPVSSLLV